MITFSVFEGVKFIDSVWKAKLPHQPIDLTDFVPQNRLENKSSVVLQGEIQLRRLFFQLNKL